MYKEWFAEFSRLVRIKNLVIIAVTQYFVRLFIINPVFFNYKIEHSLSGWQFAIFVFATLCIAAAGYIINDYFDIDIDRINKPDRVVVGKYFSRREAFRHHLILNIMGAVLGVLSAWLAGNIKLGFIFMVVAGLLWFYAKTFKKVFLLGNLIVGITTAMTVLITTYFETGMFNNTDQLALASNNEVMMLALPYTLFAFLTTVIREIIKDAEDVEGDREYDCKTVSVVLGIKGAKWVTALLLVVLIGILFMAQRYFFNEDQFVKISYILVALQLPTAAMVFYLVPAASKEDFEKLSEWMKIIMLLGMASMAVFNYF